MFWHTQGLVEFVYVVVYAEGVADVAGSWTFVMVTDRIDLDEQLYETFADSDVITGGVNVHADSSRHLRGWGLITGMCSRRSMF